MAGFGRGPRVPQTSLGTPFQGWVTSDLGHWESSSLLDYPFKKNTRFNPYLTSHIEVNLKWIIGPKVKAKTYKTYRIKHKGKTLVP